MTITIDLPPLTEPYRRPTWQEAVAGYLPERYRERGVVWARYLPHLIAILLLSVMSLRLRNTAFIDEALYINAGQDYLNHWRLGTPLPDHASAFSGAPMVYPVIAAALDAVGGLWLVRVFSLLLMAVTTLVIGDLTKQLYGYRAGVMAALVFAFTGTVVLLGSLATFDALCVTLIAVAMWVGVRWGSWPSAITVGLLLAAAVVVKYTGFIFVPVVLFVLLVAGRRPILRTAVAAVVSIGSVAAAYVYLADESVRRGIVFTTTGREALSPTTASALAGNLLVDIGPIAFVALIGALLLAKRFKAALFALAMVGAAALLPAAQMYMGEAVSFDKHTGYAALFLAPLAGRALQSISRGIYRFVPVFAILLLVFSFGLPRSGALGYEWVNVSPVLEVITDEPTPGLYISSATDVLKYYTRREDPSIAWETTFALYSLGPDTIRQAVLDERYQTVILRSASTGSPIQDEGQAVLLGSLLASPAYTAMDPIPARAYGDDAWLIFTLESPTAAEAAGVDAPQSSDEPVDAVRPSRPDADAERVRDASEASPPASARTPPDVEEEVGDEVAELEPTEPAEDEPPVGESPAAEPPAASSEAVETEAADSDVADQEAREQMVQRYEGLSRGDRGEQVALWQRLLQAWDDRALPGYGIDGVFGEETDLWTQRFFDN